MRLQNTGTSKPKMAMLRENKSRIKKTRLYSGKKRDIIMYFGVYPTYNSRFSKEDINKMVCMKNKGFTYDEIGHYFGISKRQVYEYVIRNELKK